MGVYVFSKRALTQWLSDSRPDFGHDVIPAMIDGGARVYAYRFDGYWQDVGTVQSYWEANLALLSDAPELDLYDREWIIHTRSEERGPAKIGATAQVHRSLISHGCVIDGSVVNSVLSPGVVVDVGAVVRDSIVLFDSIIRTGAVVDRAILDKEVAVGPGAIVGEGTDFDVVNRREPGRLNTGITVVGKRAVIPRGVRIGRNVLIGEGVRAADFVSRVVRSGSTVERPHERTQRTSAKAKAGAPSDIRDAASESGDRAAEVARGGRSSAVGRRAAGEASDADR
jgi:glucose-1-phosphate adenylyltransferase